MLNEVISDMMVDTWNNYSIAGMKVKDFIVYTNTLKDCLRDGKALFDKDFTIADIDTVDSVNPVSYTHLTLPTILLV